MNSQQLLKATSRAFYLSLRILPPGARQTMSLAYLLARCADSVSDGTWLPAEERAPALQQLVNCLCSRSHLDGWRDRVAVVDPGRGGEAALLHHFPQALRELDQLPSADQKLVVDIVTTLAEGMLVDLQRFPAGALGAVWDADELRRHLWAAAGCVGGFWTAVMRLHEPRLREVAPELESLGTRLGNALQLTNVLRDIPGDLAEGRCYLPTQQLLEVGLKPSDLSDPANEIRLKPLLHRWLREAHSDFAASKDYMLLIPWQCWRLRLAALWPWVMGLATLVKLAQGGWLGRAKVKVTRRWVYTMLLATGPLAISTPLLRLYLDRQLARLERAIPDVAR